MRKRNGYTLLEILIATTVLVIGLTAVFGVTQTAIRKATAAADLATVQLVCQSTMNELLADQASIKPFSARNMVELPNWRIVFNVYPSASPGLYVLHLTAQKFRLQDGVPSGAPFHLVRWVPQERVQLPQRTDVLTEMDVFDDPYR